MKKSRIIYLFSLASFLYSSNLSYIEQKAREVSFTKPKAIDSMQRKIASISFTQKSVKPESIALKHYQKMADFPDYSYPIDSEKADDTIASRFSTDKKHIVLESGDEFSFWSRKNYYQKEENVEIIFESRKEIKDSIDVSAFLKDEKIRFSKKIFSKKIVFSLPAKSLAYGEFLSIVSIKDGEKEKRAITSFGIREHFYDYKKVIGHQVTSEGNLLFDFDFDVHIQGSYVLEGTVYYQNKIIAFSEKVVDLKKGGQVLSLEFYGKIFHDKKINGKLELRNISLSYVKESLASTNIELIKTKAFTEKLTWDQFHNDSFNNPVITKKLSMVE